MNLTHSKDQVLQRVLLRMPKSASSFFYFALESNENMAFYSTLPFDRHQQYRDIEIFTTPELLEHVRGVISHYKDTCQLEILQDEVVKDSL